MYKLLKRHPDEQRWKFEGIYRLKRLAKTLIQELEDNQVEIRWEDISDQDHS